MQNDAVKSKYFEEGLEAHKADQYDAAEKLFKQAEEEGDTRALYYLYECYNNVFFSGHNWSLGQEYLQRAVKLEDPRALYALGRKYLFGSGRMDKPQKGLVYYKKAAERGYAEAAYNTAILLRNGNKVKQDAEGSARYFALAFELACREINSENNAILGHCYLNGNGVDKDEEKAFEYFIASATEGNISAQLTLGELYEKRNDRERATHWYLHAAKKYNETAIKAVARLIGSPSDRNTKTEDNDGSDLLETGKMLLNYRQFALARQWLEEAAELGNPYAFLALGDLCAKEKTGYYSDGKTGASLKYYQKALDAFNAADVAEADIPDELFHSLFECYENKKREDGSTSKLVEYARISAARGNNAAKFSLAKLYASGGVAHASIKDAIELYRSVSEERSFQGEEALIALGKCYLKGEGVERDPAKAEELFEAAFSRCKERKQSKNNWFTFTSSGYYFSGSLGHICLSVANAYSRLFVHKSENPDTPKAIAWLKRGIENEPSFDLLYSEISGLYRHGAPDLEKDYAEAVKYYLLNPSPSRYCYTNAAECYYYGGQGLKPDHAKAMKLLDKIKEDDATSHLLRGLIYERTKKSFKKAFEQYLKAEEKNCYKNGVLSARLAICYQLGKGTKKDPEKALRYFNNACSTYSLLSTDDVLELGAAFEKAIPNEVYKLYYDNSYKGGKIKERLSALTAKGFPKK